MKRLVLLLIFLLPLRIFAAEVYALRMSLPAAPTTAQSAFDVQHGAMPADCPMMAAKAADQQHPAKTSSSCQTCALCIVWVAPPEVQRLTVGAETVRTAPPKLKQRYASASLARDLRPPIS